MSKSILFIDQFSNIAGGQIVLQKLVEVAIEDGWHVGVLAPGGGDLQAKLQKDFGSQLKFENLCELELKNGQKGFHDLWRFFCFCFYVWKFWPLLRKYDVIYLNGSRLALPFTFLSIFLPGRKWFYHIHLCHSSLEKKILSFIARFPGNRRLIAASIFIQEDLVKSIPSLVDSRSLVVLENCLGRNFEELSFDDRSQKRPLKVAVIGRVAPEKGQDVLPSLARLFPQLNFMMVGRADPENKKFLDSILHEAPENLRHVGEKLDIPDFLKNESIQLSLVPSVWEEPFGLTAIESMAASCTTIVSNRGMLPLIAQRTGASCYQTREDLESILMHLQGLEPAALAQLTRQQHESAHKNFKSAKFRQKFLDLIHSRI
jgi:glycosyltransferase involved in cell wall biosynthesis